MMERNRVWFRLDAENKVGAQNKSQVEKTFGDYMKKIYLFVKFYAEHMNLLLHSKTRNACHYEGADVIFGF